MKTVKAKHLKAISVFLCLTLLISVLPTGFLQVGAATVDNRVADPHTLDQWKNFFDLQENHTQNVALSTEYAGAVWTDKSVFTPDALPSQLTGATYNGQGVTVANTGDNFVVALSAIASNKQIKGYSTIPTDTVLILDLSSSMRYTDDNNGSAVDELVEATNKAITELLTLNHNNRVAVVVYAGNVNKSFSSANGITQVVLPLDSYTTQTAGRYLVSAAVDRTPDRAIEVASGVKNSSGANMSTNRFEVSTGTFMQDGIYEAMKLLLNADTVVQEGAQIGTNRMPIMVLMTDGEPTLANNDYNGNDARTDLGVSNLSSYDGHTGEHSHRDTIAFMTSLTAAFAKKEIEAHYGTDALFYTLPYGQTVLNRPEALSVLDPENASDVQNTLWTQFLNGQSVRVFRSGNAWNSTYLTVQNSTVASEKLTAEDRLYVDEYFPAENDEQMLNAFEAIVDEIIIQSKYYPTYVEHDHDHDGYLTFVDKIGAYMSVADIQGLVVGNRLFSGAALSKMFVDGSLGSIQNPTGAGRELVNSVKTRLGISDTAVAEALLQDAYDYGQLSYTSDSEFSHYIGWFSNADGEYLDFWHKGMTSADIRETVTNKNATHIIRSYGFLGDTTVVPGVSNTDMMYMTVRVATEIATGDSILTWQIPASLIPTITYEVDVEVDSNGTITELIGLDMETGTADSPIRLVYEVAMREDIEDWNIAAKIDPAYKTANGYTFYSNKWSATASNTTENTYSHFEPSISNERYYYTQDNVVMTKTGTDTYAPYVGASKPTGSGYYHVYPVFEKLENGTLRIHQHYEPISAEALEAAIADNNQWYVPKDTVHRYYDYEIAQKEGTNPNPTGTMNYSDHPFVIKSGDTYYTYSTQGNNGKLTMAPATGIRLTKTLAAGYTSSETFTFVIGGNIANAEVVTVDADGLEADRRDLPNNGTVQLTAGQTVYIVGLTAGNYTVTEQIPQNAAYRVHTVTVNGQPIVGQAATVTLAAQTITDVEFTNGAQQYGDLIVNKDVVHPFETAPSALTDKQFTIRVDLDGDNVGGRTFTATGLAGITEVTTDNGGVFTVQLRHDESVRVHNLPANVTYTVTEQLSQTADAGYSLDMAVSTLTGTIPADGVAYGHVINRYTPAVPAEQSLVITGQKTVADTAGTFDWNGKSFTFKLEQYHPETGAYTQIGNTVSVNQNNARYTFPVIAFEALGTYYYKVSEVIPNVTDRLPGMSYDATVGRVVVHVTDNDVDGKMEVDVRDYATDTALTAVNNVYTFTKNFVNTHTTEATFVEFTVDKEVTDPHNTGVSEAGFLFGLYKVQGGVTATEPAYLMRTVGADGKATFHIPLTAVTEDTYILKEVHPADADKIHGMQYSTEEYKVVVKAEAQGGQLVPSASFEQNGTPVGAQDVVFTNVLQLTPTAETFTVNKNVVGNPVTAETFTFTLTETDSSFVTPKQGGVQQNVRITGSGSKAFDRIAYTAVGTHYYVVKETAGTKGGMTYDPAEYHLVVNVSVNNDALQTAVTMNKLGEGAVNSIQFTNVYTLSGSTALTIGGTKELLGRPMLNGEFRFNLEQVADADGTPMNNPYTSTAANRVAIGNTAPFTFEPITYTQLGEYFYRITEAVGPAGNGVTYAANEYIVKAEVTDNGNGGFASDWEIVKGGNAIAFVNTYQPRSKTVDFTAEKELIGKDLQAGEFEFALTQTEADFTTVSANGEYRVVKNDAHGMIDFGGITYAIVGKRYYTITEKMPNSPQPGVVYDNTVYRVTVDVTDNHQGALEADVSLVMVVENGTVTEIPASSAVFYNRYVVTGDATVELSGNKTLLGKTLEDDMFTFELYETNDAYKTDGVTPTTVKNANGGYRFRLAYAPEDIGKVFHYVVKETHAGTTVDGVAYDSAEYRVKVEVKDNGGVVGTVVTADGLTVSQSGTATAVSGLDFENTYTPTPKPEPTPEQKPEPQPEPMPAPQPTPEIPDTGVRAPIYLWIALLFASGGVATIFGKRKQEAE
ncbi:MAG: hypothetical protein IJP14_00940 [Clostridia bacterium]|nr:hypothetical protein [Clostridia bacterium]